MAWAPRGDAAPTPEDPVNPSNPFDLTFPHYVLRIRGRGVLSYPPELGIGLDMSLFPYPVADPAVLELEPLPGANPFISVLRGLNS
jgi:hypothetical protein